jgi:uncharacterized protein (DUF2141 family)
MRKFGPLSPARAALISLLWIPTANATDLTVNVIGLKNNKGDVHIALYDQPEKFPSPGGMRTEEEVMISKQQASIVFGNLPVGKYAIAVYHDENSNDDFDQGFLGIPLEDYGFSSGARAFFGPPSFEEADLILPDEGTTTIIDLGN